MAEIKEIVHPIGSSFESFLEEEGILEAVDELAIKEVIAWQVTEGMRKRGITKRQLATAMKTSRTQVDRLLDPTNTGVTLHTLFEAAGALGQRLSIELRDPQEDHVPIAA